MKVATKQYRCSKHGDQGGMIGVEVRLVSSPDFPLAESLKSRANRRYCMACWIDMMDANMLPLEEISLP